MKQRYIALVRKVINFFLTPLDWTPFGPFTVIFLHYRLGNVRIYVWYACQQWWRSCGISCVIVRVFKRWLFLSSVICKQSDDGQWTSSKEENVELSSAIEDFYHCCGRHWRFRRSVTSLKLTQFMRCKIT